MVCSLPRTEASQTLSPTSTLMPPTVDRMLEGIGKNALGIEAGMFNVSE